MYGGAEASTTGSGDTDAGGDRRAARRRRGAAAGQRDCRLEGPALRGRRHRGHPRPAVVGGARRRGRRCRPRPTTNTPAAYASRKASSTGSLYGSAPPEIEKLITRTPSRIARATAATESVWKQPCGAADLVDRDVRRRGDAEDRAAVDAQRVRVRDRAAGRGGGGVGAVAVGVTRGVRVHLAADHGVVGVEERPARRSACCCRRTGRPPASAGCRRSRRPAACRRRSAAVRAGCRGRRTTGARASRRCPGRRR